MHVPAVNDERTTLRNNLDDQLNAIRDAGYGLNEDQLRSTPLRSQLSLSGLLKHATWCMAGALNAAGLMDDSPVDLADFYGNFTLEADRSVEALRGDFENVKERYLAMVDGCDLDQVMPCPPAPWYGMPGGQDVNLRYFVVHHVEEFARHAGHADIIREEIDGAQAASLNATVEGREANEFVTPWAPNA